MKAQQFDDLISWQKVRELIAAIYSLTGESTFAKDFGLRDQIQRAAVLIMSDLAEGFECGSQPDFHRFVVIAKASCAEIRSQPYVAFDIGYIKEDKLKQHQTQVNELARIIGGLHSTLLKISK